MVKSRSSSHITHEVRHTEAQKAVILTSLAVIVLILLVGTLIYFAPENVVGKVGEEPAVCTPVPSGVVGWWRGEDNVQSQLPAERDLIEPFNLAYESGKVGKAFKFNGVDSVAMVQKFQDRNVFYYPFGHDDLVGDDPNPNDDRWNGISRTPFSVELWFKTNSNGIIFGQNGFQRDDVLRGYVPAIYIGLDGKLRVQLFWGNVQSLAAQAVPITLDDNVVDNVPHYLAVTYDGITEKVFLDGQLKGSLGTVEDPFVQHSYTNLGAPNNDKGYVYNLGFGWDINWPGGYGVWDFGVNDPSSKHYFNGLIDEFTVYNRALTETEIQQIYTADTAGKCTTEIGYAQCHDGIDNDNNGEMDCADLAGCNKHSDTKLAENSEYEVTIHSNDCPEAKIKITNASNSIVGSNFFICDASTQGLADYVGVCDSMGLNPTPLVTLESLESMSTQARKVPFQKSDVTFVYGRTNGIKNVSLILTRDLFTPQKFPLEQFTQNVLDGQHLIFTLDTEYYQLGYPQGESRFTTERLQLVQLPSGTPYTAVVYPGTNKYIFTLSGGRSIVVGIGEGADDGTMVISSLRPGETPVARLVQNDLSQSLEVSFNLVNPVTITNPPLGDLTICRTDNAADTQQAQICQADVPLATLRNGDLKEVTIDRVNYALLYEYKNNQKQVSIFEIETLSNINTELNYNDFINAMIAGRRVALKFQDTLYLAQHPMQATISLPLITLTVYQAVGTTILTSGGSEDLVEFPSMDGGKIFLQRFYGTPPPPFRMYAKTRGELGPIDFNKDFFTRLSSLVSVNVANPSYGLVGVAADDTSLYQPTFKISIGATPKILNYLQPYEHITTNQNTTLFYYHSASLDGAVPVKSADIYLFFNISRTPKTRSFNDTFIQTITSGKEIALGFGSSYYLLGHRGNAGQVAFYDPAQLTLRKLDGSEVYPVNYDITTGATFNVPQGAINIKENNVAKTITFKTETSTSLSTVEFSDYATVITPVNRVHVGTSTFRLCYQTAYADLPSTKVCDEVGTLPDVVVDPIKVIMVGSTSYLLESNQQTGDQKRVTIRKIIPLTTGLLGSPTFNIPDWVGFVNLYTADKLPLFNISRTLYSTSTPSGQLRDLGLSAYPSGIAQTPQAMNQLTPISFNGSIVLKDSILVVTQTETANEDAPLEASISLRSYKYLPQNGDPLFINTTLAPRSGVTPPAVRNRVFVTSLVGKLYDLTVDNVVPANPNLRKVTLKTGTTTLLDRSFAAGDVRTLVLDGTRVEIKVVEINTIYTYVTIKRVG